MFKCLNFIVFSITCSLLLSCSSATNRFNQETYSKLTDLKALADLTLSACAENRADFNSSLAQERMYELELHSYKVLHWARSYYLTNNDSTPDVILAQLESVHQMVDDLNARFYSSRIIDDQCQKLSLEALSTTDSQAFCLSSAYCKIKGNNLSKAIEIALLTEKQKLP